MSVYASFGGSQEGFDAAAAKLKEYLESTGYFTAVTIDSSTHVVSCTYGGTTAATFQFEYNGSGYYGKFKLTFGGYSNTDGFSISSDDGTIWIGKSSVGVAVGVMQSSSGSITTRCIICKSRANVPMMLLYSNALSSITVLTADNATEPESVTISSPSSNAYYSNLCGVCTQYAGEETSAAASNVYRFIERQTSVTDASMSKIDIDGTKFLSDGFFALLDN